MNGWRTNSIDVEAAGARFRVAYAERGGLEASGPPLLYLHGLGSSRRDFEPAAAAPQLSGRRLLAVDLPGSGASRLPPGPEPAVGALVEIVASLLRSLACERVHLIGHSMGGLVGLLVASAIPRRVATFTNIEGNLAPVDCRVFSRRVVVLARERSPGVVVRLLADELAASDRADYATFAERFTSQVEPRAFVAYCRSIVVISRGQRLLEAFLDLELPRLFVHGEENGDLPYLETLARSGIEVVEIPRSDHFPLYSNPDRLISVLAAFLDRHDGRAPVRLASAPIARS